MRGRSAPARHAATADAASSAATTRTSGGSAAGLIDSHAAVAAALAASVDGARRSLSAALRAAERRSFAAAHGAARREAAAVAAEAAASAAVSAATALTRRAELRAAHASALQRRAEAAANTLANTPSAHRTRHADVTIPSGMQRLPSRSWNKAAVGPQVPLLAAAVVQPAGCASQGTRSPPSDRLDAARQLASADALLSPQQQGTTTTRIATHDVADTSPSPATLLESIAEYAEVVAPLTPLSRVTDRNLQPGPLRDDTSTALQSARTGATVGASHISAKRAPSPTPQHAPPNAVLPSRACAGSGHDTAAEATVLIAAARDAACEAAALVVHAKGLAAAAGEAHAAARALLAAAAAAGADMQAAAAAATRVASDSHSEGTQFAARALAACQTAEMMRDAAGAALGSLLRGAAGINASMDRSRGAMADAVARCDATIAQTEYLRSMLCSSAAAVAARIDATAARVDLAASAVLAVEGAMTASSTTAPP